MLLDLIRECEPFYLKRVTRVNVRLRTVNTAAFHVEAEPSPNFFGRVLVQTARLQLTATQKTQKTHSPSLFYVNTRILA